MAKIRQSGRRGQVALATAAALAFAACGGQLTFELPVTGASLSSITVTSAQSHIASGGATVQLTATGNYSDGTTADLTASASWSSSLGGAATVAAGGLATSGASGGIPVLTATSGGVSGSASLKVTGLVTTITVGNSPADALVRPGTNEVWVSNNPDHTISVINTTTNSVVATIDIGGGKSTNLITFLPDGSKAYVVNGSGATIESINAVTRVVNTPIVVAAVAGQVGVSPDGASAIVPINAGSPAVYKITTSTDAIASFNATPTCPTGADFLPATNVLYVSDQCHGPDFVWHYDFPTAVPPSHVTGSAGFVAGNVFASPDSTRVFAVGSPKTMMIRTSDDSILQTISDNGGISFFGDSTRMIWGQVTAGNFSVYDYTGNSLALLDTISFTPGGRAAITSTRTLYLPISGTSVKVYQYY